MSISGEKRLLRSTKKPSPTRRAVHQRQCILTRAQIATSKQNQTTTSCPNTCHSTIEPDFDWGQLRGKAMSAFSSPPKDNSSDAVRDISHQLRFWTEQLIECPPARIPHDHAVSATSDCADEDVSILNARSYLDFVVGVDSFNDTKNYCQERRLELWAGLLAAFRATLFRIARVEDHVVATSIRRSATSPEQCARSFVRAHVDCETSFSKLTRIVSDAVDTAQDNNDVDSERILSAVQRSEPSRTALAHVLFAFNLQSGLQSVDKISESGQPFEVEFHICHSTDSSLRGRISYASHLFESSTIQGVVDVFHALLRQGVHAPEDAIECLPLDSALRSNGSPQIKHAAYPRDASIVDIFREEAAQLPHAIAVKEWGSQSILTYSQLDDQSDKLASFLRRFRFTPGTPVAVLAPRSCMTIVSFLGILKANLAYVPMDPMAPALRNRVVLDSLPQCTLLLLDDQVDKRTLDRRDVEIYRFADIMLEKQLDQQRLQHMTAPSATALAYILFTSGSSGVPKGVMIEHRGVVRLVKNGSTVQKLPSKPRMAHLSNLVFDASTWEIWTALLNGGTLLCIDQSTVLDPEALVTVFAEEQLDGAVMTPTLFKQCCATSLFKGLKVLHLAGEPLASVDAKNARDAVSGVVYNAYGPTENTVASTIYQIPKEGNCIFPNGTPIGKAINGSGAHILDSKQRIVPRGVVGELVVTGDGLARSYTDPALNEGRFVVISMGSRRLRAYRTGDLARERFDGEIEYHGRIDQQIKVRGHRVEVTELEKALLRSHSSIAAAAAVVWHRDENDTQLVAFVVLRQGTACSDAPAQSSSTIQHARQRLRDSLPSYMQPNHIFVLSELPVNASGKLDQKQLIAEARSLVETRSIEDSSSVGSVETAVCEELSQILGRKVALTANFLDLGGHSITAMRLAARLRHRLNVGLAVKDIFDHTEISDLVLKIRDLESSLNEPNPEPCGLERAELSFAQGRLWFLRQLNSVNTADLVPFALRLQGNLQIDALRRAFEALQGRHEALRTTFEQSLEDEVPVQVIRPAQPFHLDVTGLAGGELLLSSLQAMVRPFDLTRELAWKVCLFRISSSEAVLALVVHHIIWDEWSASILFRELGEYYSRACCGDVNLPSLISPLRVQYSDFAVWQKQRAQGTDYELQLQYWKDSLKESVPAEFLCDYPRPSVPSYHAATVEFFIGMEDAAQNGLKAICKAEGVTPYIALLAAFRAAHFRLTQASDATIGTPVANRETGELQDIIGLFVNIQCIRTRIDESTSFSALVQQTKASVTEALANQDVPFEQVVSACRPGVRDTSRNPLVQVLFAHHTQMDLEDVHLKGLEVSREPLPPASTRFDIEFHLYQDRSGIRGEVLFATDLFKPSTIQCVIDVLKEILKRGKEDTALSCLPLSGVLSDELHCSISQIKTVQYLRDSSIVDIWRDHVRMFSDAVAVEDKSSQMTYRELDESSDRIAAWLSRQNSAAESLVGVLAPRSCETIAVFLGVLKANLAYLPLDTRAHAGRIDSILSCAPSCNFVILGSGVSRPAVSRDVQFVNYLDICSISADFQPTIKPSATSLAYVMFTSGSTGTPKGVMVEHRGIVRLVKNGTAVEGLPLPPRLRIANLSNLVFDASTWEIWAALLNGGTLVCLDYESVVDVHALGQAFQEHAVSAAVLTPALVRECLEHSPETLSRLQFLHVGGDRFRDVDATAAKKLVPIVNNVYGPTENTVLSTIHSVQDEEVFANGVPIGSAINNSGAFVTDSRQQLVPPGVIGELVVTGDGLARGYTEERLNENRFVQLKIDGQSVRAYRTGDSVRCRPDGVLECFQRIDTQVKVRGHRIEMAEVEHALLRQPLISDAAVVKRKRQTPHGEELDLVAFVIIRAQDDDLTPEDHGTAEINHLESLELTFLDDARSRLPSFMVPTRIIVLDRLPLNANGKVDRRLLETKAQELPAEAAGGRKADQACPDNYFERIICEVFASVLGIDKVNATDNFFELGGHSLMATRCAARLGRRLNSNISVKDIFDDPVPTKLAAKAQKLTRPYDGIPRCTSTKAISLSFAQARLFFLDQLVSRTWYLVPLTIRISGALNVSALEQAIHALEQRHDILRTTFRVHDTTSEPLDDDEHHNSLAMQVVHSFSGAPLAVSRIQEGTNQLEEELLREQTRPFDLIKDPGWRVRLFQYTSGEMKPTEDFVLSIVMHHICTDGWSVDVLSRELALFYSAACRKADLLAQVKPLPIQYRDFAGWQQQPSRAAEYRDQLDFWTTQLESSQPAEIPEDFLRPAIPSGKAGVIDIQLDQALCESFNQFGDLTPFMILFTAFRIAHYRTTEMEDATIATPIANRNRQELEDLIGFFVNTLCIRTTVDESMSFRDHLEQVKGASVAAFQNQDVPFEQIVSKLRPNTHDTSKNPLAQILFAVHPQPDLGEIKLDGLTTNMMRPLNPTTRMDLEIHLYRSEKGFEGYALFATDLFCRETIQALIDPFHRILKQASKAPDSPIGSMPLSEPEAKAQQQVNGVHNKPTAEPLNWSITDLFSRQVGLHPDVIAVEDSVTYLTYAQLDQKTDRLAAWLRDKALPREALIGVLSGRSCQTVMVYLAVLKANLCYVPMDPNFPQARIEALVSDSNVRLLLVEDGVQFSETSGLGISLIPIPEAIAESQGAAVRSLSAEAKPTASSLATVMFTSGSTGLPKGVMTEHGSIVRRTTGTQGSNLPPACRVAHFSNVIWDASTWELYTALLNGGTVVCIDRMTVLDAKALGNLFQDHHVQASMMTPAVLKQLMRYSPKSFEGFELLHIIGERLSVWDAKHIRGLVAGALYNSYGPTEATILSTSYEIPWDERALVNDVPIGKAIEHTGTHVVDSKLRPVPDGSVGELILSGCGIARGFTDPSLDKDCFFNLSIDGIPTRAYRTGDRVRVRPKDGQLIFLGRMDNQIKIRSQRVDLGEIEKAIVNNCEEATDAVVVTRNIADRGLELIAFVLGSTTAELTDDEDGSSFDEADENNKTAWDISQRLAEILPSHMLPAQVVVISHIPLTPNGKVDRRKLASEASNLPADVHTSKPRSTYVSPRTSTEASLCKIYAEILEQPLESVGTSDSFFALGGHSLMAMKLAAHASQKLATSISVRDVFDNPVIADLATKIDANSSSVQIDDPIVPSDESSPAPLSFAQRRLWFLGELGIGDVEYLMPIAANLEGLLSIPALETSLQVIEQRHDVLRTTFVQKDGEPVQFVHAYCPRRLRTIKGTANDIQEILRVEQTTPFDLACEPGWRVCLLQIHPEQHILSMVMHHSISDGWSIDRLVYELGTLYKAALYQPWRSEHDLQSLSSLKPLPIQYRDFAAWQQQSQIQAAEHQRQLDYWKKQLAGSQPAEFYCDYPRPQTPSGDAHEIDFTIEGEVYDGLLSFGQEHQATLFAILLAAFRASHFRLTATEDATIGSAVANRNRPELHDLIGLFVNIQCLRIALDQDTTFSELVETVKTITADAFANQDVPFERLVSELRPGLRDRNPLAQIFFVLHEQENLGAIELDGLKSKQMPSPPTTRVDCELHVYRAPSMLRGRAVFAKSLFDSATGEMIINVFQEMVRRAICTPHIPVSQVPLIDGVPELRKRGLLTAPCPPYPREKSVVDVFHEQVATSPSMIAIEDGLTPLTYSQLAKESDILAEYLCTRWSLPAESLVGIMAPRSCEAIIAMIGVLKANLAYLPLDEKAPPAWTEKILAASGCRLVLANSSAPKPTISRSDVDVVHISEARSQQPARGASPTGHQAMPKQTSPGPRSLMYVMFTSGSTGEPKGVMIEHRGIVRLMKNSTAARQLSRAHRIAHLANIFFDAASWEIYGALLNGHTVVCIDYLTLLDPRAMRQTFIDKRVDAACMTPSLLRRCWDCSPNAVEVLTTLHIAGEMLHGRDAIRARQAMQHRFNGDSKSSLIPAVYNAYGPTENSVASTIFEITSDVATGIVPIGRPIDNSGALIMDVQQRLVSPGVIGELVVTGDGLARGYVQASANIDRFIEIDDPDQDPAQNQRIRAYRTGDLARMRHDGQIECLGRVDEQVKIRGHRTDLTLVERAITDHFTSLREAVAVTVTSPDSSNLESDEEVVCFVTAFAPTTDSHKPLARKEELDAHSSDNTEAKKFSEKRALGFLRTQLPKYMVPARVVALESMPLNANGKTDMRELRRLASSLPLVSRAGALDSGIAKPRTCNTLEAVICEELAQLRGVETAHIDPEEDFFNMGGHSLLATRLAARIGSRLNVKVEVKDIFDCPILSDLASRIGKLGCSTSYQKIQKREHEEHTELSFAQARLWFLDRLDWSQTWYLMPFALRLRGVLNVAALEAALQAIEHRHEILRTTFTQHNGIATQIVHPFQARRLEVVTLATQEQLLETLYHEQGKPFNLVEGPSWRARLYQLESDAHDNTLSIVMHHLISDGWSVDIMSRELAGLYKAACNGVDPLTHLKPLEIQYRDFAAWERETQTLESSVFRAQLDYWEQQLADSMPAELLCDHSRPSDSSNEESMSDAGAVEFSIHGKAYDSLLRFCQLHRVTPFVVLAAVFRVTHYRFTGSEDATIATPSANRRNRQELEDLIGFFVNTLCLRIKVESDTTFQALVEQVRQKATEAQANQDIPFDVIVSKLFDSLPGMKRDLSRNPLVQILFAFHPQQGLGTVELEGLQVEPAPTRSYTRFDMEFHLTQSVDSLNGGILFSTQLFERATMQSLVAVFQRVLEEAVLDPTLPVASVPLNDANTQGSMSDTMDSQLPVRCDTQDWTIAAAFKQQVAMAPDLVAVQHTSSPGKGDQLLTYAELNSQSDVLAQWLQVRQFPKGTPVAVFASRSCSAVIAMLGIWKANLAYLPLDHRTPMGRIETILSSLPESKLVLVGDQDRMPALTQSGVDVVRVRDALRSQPMRPNGYSETGRQLDGSTLACVFFTSGSTGTPKGVQIEHRGLVQLASKSGIAAHGRTAHLTSLAFDVSLWEILGALLTGGTVICIDHLTILDPAALGQAIHQESIETAILTPALLKQCLNHDSIHLRTLKRIYVSGDRLDPADAARLSNLPAMTWNAYGPTENSIESTMYPLCAGGKDYPNGVPIGAALPGRGAYVVDSSLRIVPAGVLGELVLTGQGLARGYTDPSLNANRFVELKVGSKIVRAYRTGDLTRVRPTDGQLECFGRLDRQVKIRGHRIELDGIQNTILEHESVDDAAVLLFDNSSNESSGLSEPQLLGFLSASASGYQQSQQDVNDQVLDWEHHFDSHMFADVSTIDSSELGRDFLGWNSMLDGHPIDKAEMQEWLDDTIQTIVGSKGLHHVLEVGTGTGMILFNLPQTLKSYVGIEPSRSAAAFVTRMIDSVAHLKGKAKVHVGTALDVKSIEGLQPEVVVLNSVVQYFPSAEYLLDFTTSITRLPTVSKIVFGDVRSLPLNRQFQIARVLFSNQKRLSLKEVRHAMLRLDAQEEELLVDPTFFTSLQRRMPAVIKHVEILPKKMKAANELSSYRYSAVLHLHNQDGYALNIVDLTKAEWVDFKHFALDGDGIAKRLVDSPKMSTFAVGNIPYKNTVFERALLEAVDSETEQWFAEGKKAANSFNSLSVHELIEIGERAGFRTHFSWARQRSQNGGLDVVFHRRQSDEVSEFMFKFPTEQWMDPLACTNRLDHYFHRKVKESVKEHLQQKLPSYMIPSDLFVMERLPLNANGKVDRQALVKHAEAMSKSSNLAASATYCAPRDEVEAVLCEDFAHVLGTQATGISVHDDFFDLGGHSLMATRLAARISQRVGKLSVRDIFDHSVLADLADHIRPLSGAAQMPISKFPNTELAPLSFGQSRLWFLEHLNPTSYLMPLALRIRGPLNEEALQAALQALQDRHNTLRTTLRREGVSTFQVIQDHQTLPFSISTFGGESAPELALRALAKEQTCPFDLTKEPGFRARLFRLPDSPQGQESIFSIVIHHVFCDGWSLSILFRELRNFYAMACDRINPSTEVEPLPIQYTDYVRWQASQADMWSKQREYWADMLQDSRPAELPTDSVRPSVPSGEAGTREFTIDGPLHSRLQHFCKEHRITTVVALLAVFRAAHYRLTGVNDAVVGSPVANRGRQEIQGLIGFFVNLQCMRIRIDEEDTTFVTLVQQAKNVVADALENQDLPFENVAAELRPNHNDLSRNPLVQLMFAVHQQGMDQIHLQGLKCESIQPVSPTTRFDVEFHIYEEEESLQGSVLFDRSLYHARTVETLITTFQELLRRGIAEPLTRIQDLELSDGVTNDNARGWISIDRVTYPEDSNIVDLFREQARRHTDKTAVRHGTRFLSYGELDNLSDHLAAWLSQHSFQSESLVGTYIPRSCEAVVAFLGILKAGLAYLPLDVQAPPARSQNILRSVPGCKLVLVSSEAAQNLKLSEDAKAIDVQFVDISEALSEQSKPRTPPRAVCIQPNDLAYVVFTSGSTGKPKGIMTEHRSIVRLVKNGSAVKDLPDEARIAHMSNLAFDAATWEIYGALLNGGTVECLDHMTVLDSKRLQQAFGREPRIQAAFFTPVLLASTLSHASAALKNLRLVFVGGERLDPDEMTMARRLLPPEAAFYSAYGPTENTTYSCLHKITSDSTFSNGVPLGKTISNSGAFVVDSHQRLVSSGVLGELVVSGDGLARGYMDGSLTNRSFYDMSMPDGSLVRAYRTGDRVRMRPKDGVFEFFGRIDHQLKIRGHRIELGEIEGMLTAQKMVKNAIVIVLKTEVERELELVAFITATTDAPQDETARKHFLHQVRQRLRTHLPPYMIPAKMAILDRLPMNANGKVDRSALQKMPEGVPRIADETGPAYRPPRNEIEEQLCKLYKTALVKLPEDTKVGIDDSFFELGGHSLLATALTALIRRDMGVDIAVKDVFEQPKVIDLAAKIREFSQLSSHTNDTEAYTPFQLLGDLPDPEGFITSTILKQVPFVERSDVEDIYPVNQIQKTSLRDPDTGLPQPWVNFHWDLSSSQDMGRVGEACRGLALHFDIFRTVFVAVGETFYQVVLKDIEVPVEVLDVDTDFETASNEILERYDPWSSYRPGQALLRFTVLRHGATGELRVLLNISHALYDGLSFEHITSAFHAFLKQESLPAAPPFARYIKQMLSSQDLGLQHWRSLLQGSSMTIFSSPGEDSDAKGCHLATRTLRLPQNQRPDGITPATIFTTACALMLANQVPDTTSDIVFGRVVSGRQGLPLQDQTLVGPCTNTILVRANANLTKANNKPNDLLRSIQSQYTLSLPHETLPYDLIRQHSTSWPANTPIWCATAFHDFSLGEAKVGEMQYHKYTERNSVYEVEIGCSVGKTGEMEMSVLGRKRSFGKRAVEGMLEGVCGGMERFWGSG